MDYRSLGASGLNVPVFGLSSASFGGGAGSRQGVDEKAAARLVSIAIERGAAFFDTGDFCGYSEEVLGKSLAKRRSQALIATKAGLRAGEGANTIGASRHHLIEACERSLKRLGADYIDLFQIHCFDARTPVEETLSTLDRLIAAGKVRYVGCSNYAGWQLMKSLAASDRNGWARFVSHQIAWSLAARDAEWELMPLAADQNVGNLVWGALAGGLLSGKYGRRGLPFPALQTTKALQRSVPDAQMSDIIDCLGEVAKETGATPIQVSLAWMLQRPTVSTLLVEAGSAEQFEECLDTVELRLSGDQLVRLDEVSARPPAYPYSLQQEIGAERTVIPRPPVNVRVDKELVQPRGDK